MLKLNKLESDVLGRKVATAYIDHSGSTGERADFIMNKAMFSNTKLLCMTVKDDDPLCRKVAERLGMSLITTNLNFVYDMDGKIHDHPITKATHTYIVETPPDQISRPKIIELIEKKAFIHSRWYQDEQVASIDADKIFTAWMPHHQRWAVIWNTNSFYSFAAINFKPEPEIMMVATSPAGKGRGWGSAAVTRLLMRAQQKGFDFVKVTAQSTNVPAIRMYQRLGFKYSHTDLVYHKWLSR